MDITLTGKFDDPNDTFFTGVCETPEGRTVHLGEPLEEFIILQKLLIESGSVNIRFVSSKDAVTEAEDYFDL